MRTLIVAALLLFSSASFSQSDLPKLKWSKCFGTIRSEMLSDMALSANGSFFLVGSVDGSSFKEKADDDTTNTPPDFTINIFDCYVVKADANGNAIWQSRIGGKGIDFARSVIATPDGGCLIVGHTNSFEIEGLPTGLRAKKSIFGALVDTLIFKGQDLRGRILTSPDAMIAKIDRTGKLDWVKCYGDKKDDKAAKIIRSNDGNYLVLVSADDGKKIQVLKIDGSGKTIKTFSFNSPSNNIANPIDIVQMPDLTYVLASSIQKKADNASPTDTWFIKFNESGKILAQSNWGGNGNDHPTSLLLDGNRLLATCTSNSTKGAFSENKESDGWLLELDEKLEIIPHRYGGSKEDGFTSIIATPDGYIISGHANSPEIPGLHSFKNNLSEHEKPANEMGDMIGDVWILKIDKNYAKITEYCFGGSSMDGAVRVINSADGYVFGALTFSTDGDVTANYANRGEQRDEREMLKMPPGDFWLAKVNFIENNCSQITRKLENITGAMLTSLEANPGKKNTKIQIHSGDYVFLSTKGTISLGKSKDSNGDVNDYIVSPTGKATSNFVKKVTSTFKYGQLLAVVKEDTIPFELFKLPAGCDYIPDEIFARYAFFFKNNYTAYFIAHTDGELELMVNDLETANNSGGYQLELYTLSRQEHEYRNCFNACPEKQPILLKEDTYVDDFNNTWSENGELPGIYDKIVEDCYHCGFTDYRALTSNNYGNVDVTGCQCVYDNTGTLVNLPNCLGTFDYGYWKSKNDFILHAILDIIPHWLWRAEENGFLYFRTQKILK